MPREKYQVGEYWLTQRGGSENWYREWYDTSAKRTRRVSLRTKDFQLAKQKLDEWFITQGDLSDQSPESMLIDLVLIRYWEQHLRYKAGKSANHQCLAKWQKFYSGCTVSDLTIKRQKQFIQHLRSEGHADGYIQKILTLGRAGLNRAVKYGELTSFQHIEMVYGKGEGVRPLNINEVAEFFNKLEEDRNSFKDKKKFKENEHLFLFMMIVLNTTARPDSVFDINMAEQVCFEDRFIELNAITRAQTNKRRAVVPITNTLMPWLLSIRGQTYALEYRGQRIKSIRTLFNKIKSKTSMANDPKVTPRSFRKTAATELRRRGVDRYDIKNIMGHADRDITDVYAKYDPKFQQAAVNAFDDYFRELQPLVVRKLAMQPVASSEYKTGA